MSTPTELQTEEREVLLSIYEGDSRFKETSPTTYQYKYGEDDHPKSFLVEISWPPDYPMKKPIFNLNLFYNKHLTEEVKIYIATELEKECELYLGEAMTYTLFELIKERENELTEAQPEIILTAPVEEKEVRQQEPSKKAEKKEQLSKAQKRRQWDRTDHKGEKPRGWNWVDLVKHLSQTGPKQENDPTPTT